MALQVEIEKHSGFCGGVIRAIGRAEKFLEESPGKTLYSLGDIVHNEAELRRLGEKGLVTINKDGLMNIPDPSSETLLIRAHGEPPQTYSLARELGLTVIDCTCPVVLKLQKSIREAYERVKPAGAQIVISGKIGRRGLAVRITLELSVHLFLHVSIDVFYQQILTQLLPAGGSGV